MSPRSNPSSSKRRPTGSRHQPRPCPHRRPLRLEPLEDRRLLALVTVTTALDTVDFNDGVTSLREAIFATNTVPGVDTIRFEFGHDANEDGPATILLTQGELKITDSLTIDGPGADLLTIDGNGNFKIDDGQSNSLIDVEIGSLTLHSVEIASVENTTVRNIVAHSLRPDGGSLMVIDSVVTGGGVRVRNTDVTVTGSRIAEAELGIYLSGGNLTVVDSTISENRVGIAGAAKSVSVAGSSISNNAERGIWLSRSNAAGPSPPLEGPLYLTVTDSTISNNGFSIDPIYGSVGMGGITTSDVQVTVSRSVISGNTVGSGSFFYAGGITVVRGNLKSTGVCCPTINATYRLAVRALPAASPYGMEISKLPTVH